MRLPDYTGGSTVNLVAELERRLRGDSPSPGLNPELAAVIPEAATYVFVLFDGLGDHQLDHPAAGTLQGHRQASLDSVFPSTTTVSLATIATALPPVAHGLLGYQLWIPEAETVVNTIKWTTLWGDPVEYPVGDLLPEPNLWERLAAAGCEPITVQPAHFVNSALSRALYRGCRFEPVFTEDEIVETTRDVAAVPGRLVLVYVPHVDFAAHVNGQDSAEYADAMDTATRVWERLARALPSDAVLIGSADHGHVDFPKDRQVAIAKEDHEDRTFYGDGRVMFVKGDGASLAPRLPARWVSIEDMTGWWGPGPAHPQFAGRAPDGALLADEGYLLLHRYSDNRMVGNHGGLTDPERRVPLLVAGG